MIEAAGVCVCQCAGPGPGPAPAAGPASGAGASAGAHAWPCNRHRALCCAVLCCDVLCCAVLPPCLQERHIPAALQAKVRRYFVQVWAPHAGGSCFSVCSAPLLSALLCSAPRGPSPTAGGCSRPDARWNAGAGAGSRQGWVELSKRCAACCLAGWPQASMTRSTLKTFPWSSGQPLRKFCVCSPCWLVSPPSYRRPSATLTCPRLPPPAPARHPRHPPVPLQGGDCEPAGRGDAAALKHVQTAG